MTTGHDWITLQNDALGVEINPLGAELSALRDAAGCDLLWNGDPAFWSGRAPVLFPVVGELRDGRHLWQGKAYAMPRHGFARRRPFLPIHQDDTEVLLRQAADPQTLQVYPFAFELDVRFLLEGNVLVTTATVRNKGTGDMPASLGFHPAFRWPLPQGGPREAHVVEFETEEPAPIRRLDSRGLLVAQRHATPVQGRRLALQDALFEEDVVIFDALRSRRLDYGGGTGPRLRISFPGATHLGLWSKPGAGFVCIEPWRGVADPADFAGTLGDKPGIFTVAAGAEQSLQMRIEVGAA